MVHFLKTFERYRDHLDGGGRTSGMEYLPLFHDLGLPRQPRVFERCAGPGFIGFALLGYGFCDTLCLAGVNPEAVEACPAASIKRCSAGTAHSRGSV